MSVSMDEVNYLVWRYMQENGFPHAAFVFDTECNAGATNIPGAQIPPNALITLLQKSLIYLKIEKRIREVRKDASSNIASELEKIESATRLDGAATSTPVKRLTARDVQSLKIESQAVSSIRFSPDGTKVAALQSDGRCVISNGGKCVTCGHRTPDLVRCPSALAWSGAGDMLAIAGSDDTSVFTSDGNSVAVIPGSASAVQFCQDRPLLAVCSLSDFVVSIYEIKEGSAHKLESFSIHKSIIYDISWRDAGLIATASGDRCVGIFTVSGGSQVLRGHVQPVTVVAFSSGNGMLASGGDDGVVRIWKDGHPGPVLKGHSGGITGIVWHPNNHSLVASSSTDGSVKIWDAISGECQSTLAHHTNGINAVQFHPSGKFLLTGGKDKIFALWSFPDGEMVQAFSTGHVVNGFDFDAKGENVAVCFDASSAIVLSTTQYLR